MDKKSDNNKKAVNEEKEVTQMKKYQIFDKHLEETQMTNVFQKEVVKDELNTVLYRSYMEIEGFQLPLVIIIDDSIYTIIRILVKGKGVDENNRAEVVKLINELNATYKAFKYMLTDNGEIVLDICLPCTNTTFDPNMIRVMMDVSIRNLTENYKKIIKTVL